MLTVEEIIDADKHKKACNYEEGSCFGVRDEADLRDSRSLSKPNKKINSQTIKLTDTLSARVSLLFNMYNNDPIQDGYIVNNIDSWSCPFTEIVTKKVYVVEEYK